MEAGAASPTRLAVARLGQRNELRSHCAPVENLERHDRANGGAAIGVLSVGVHTERTTRIGVEVPRVAVVILRRRPNVLIVITSASVNIS